MANIELVIKITEDLYKATINGLDANDIWALRLAVKNGTPLPKRHGRLIILSEDAVKRERRHFSFSCQNWISEIGLSNATVTIIEVDKVEPQESEEI